MNWWISIIVALIGAAPPSFLAWLAWRGVRSVRIQGAESHKLVNSRMDELLKLTRKTALAQGKLEGRAAEKKLNKTKD